MREITLEELLEAGCHFGHQVTRYNPKAREFIFEARDGIHIIDLAQTKQGLEEAGAFVRSVAARPDSSILIVGTKRQVQSILSEELQRAQTALQDSSQAVFSVTTRWLGGTLTNFSEMAKNYKKLKDITARLKNEEEKEKYTKKEIGQWEKERQKLQSFYGGVADMKKVPDVMFVIDTHMENLAVLEGRRMGTPVVGIVDTNADPTLVDYGIPANDDAVGSLKLIVSYILDAWVEGKTKGVDEIKAPKTEQKVAKNKKLETNEGASATKTVEEKKTRKKKE